MPGEPIQFDVQTGFDEDVLRDQVAYALSLGLPEIDEGRANSQPIYVYANGPSAIDAPRHYPAVALNGAYKLPTFKHRKPEYWIACDPQALVAGFIDRPSDWCAYLVASKCHKAVFDKLVGKDITLWHVDDCSAPDRPNRIPTAVSVTVVTLGLLYKLGYRDITVYGWDCCYIDGKDHAVSQGHSGNDIEVEVGGTVYQTTTTWAAEVQDARDYLQLVPGLKLKIEGPGMVGAVLRAKGLI